MAPGSALLTMLYCVSTCLRGAHSLQKKRGCTHGRVLILRNLEPGMKAYFNLITIRGGLCPPLACLGFALAFEDLSMLRSPTERKIGEGKAYAYLSRAGAWSWIRADEGCVVITEW